VNFWETFFFSIKYGFERRHEQDGDFVQRHKLQQLELSLETYLEKNLVKFIKKDLNSLLEKAIGEDVKNKLLTDEKKCKSTIVKSTIINLSVSKEMKQPKK